MIEAVLMGVGWEIDMSGECNNCKALLLKLRHLGMLSMLRMLSVLRMLSGRGMKMGENRERGERGGEGRGEMCWM